MGLWLPNVSHVQPHSHRRQQHLEQHTHCHSGAGDVLLRVQGVHASSVCKLHPSLELPWHTSARCKETHLPATVSINLVHDLCKKDAGIWVSSHVCPPSMFLLLDSGLLFFLHVCRPGRVGTHQAHLRHTSGTHQAHLKHTSGRIGTHQARLSNT